MRARALGIQHFNETQQKILRFLLKNQQEATIEELVTHLEVTRTAVVQHLSALQREGYVEKSSFLRSLKAGRPSRSFVLTTRGHELFPKQYSWFSSLMLELLKKQGGAKGLQEAMRHMARSLAPAVQSPREVVNVKTRLQETVRIMNELSYEASLESEISSQSQLPAIQAHNCVFHHLAQTHQEVCEFDLEILRLLTGLEPHHVECLVRGGKTCRFTFRSPTP